MARCLVLPLCVTAPSAPHGSDVKHATQSFDEFEPSGFDVIDDSQIASDSRDANRMCDMIGGRTRSFYFAVCLAPISMSGLRGGGGTGGDDGDVPPCQWHIPWADEQWTTVPARHGACNSQCYSDVTPLGFCAPEGINVFGKDTCMILADRARHTVWGSVESFVVCLLSANAVRVGAAAWPRTNRFAQLLVFLNSTKTKSLTV